MKRKRILTIIILVILVIAVTGYVINILRQDRNSFFQFSTVERGDIKNTITSTGILHPRSKVEVGTQISGTFANVFVDYNDVVKKGQLLAELDKKILLAALDEAKAVVMHTKEKFKFSKNEYLKKKELYKSNYLSEIEFFKFQSTYYIDSSAYLSAKANLDKAYTNLDYASIVSPISGTVIEKNVEAGQTVAANFATPTVFVIAEDLSKMEIHATVDESDISYVFEGQEVEFSVLAYPDSIFTGVINQIRMHPRMIQNVVNYIVVINTDNNYGLLLPGMTATVDFIIEQKKDVLMVAKSAVNFRPPKNMVDKFHKNMRKKIEALPDSLKPQMQPPPPPEDIKQQPDPGKQQPQTQHLQSPPGPPGETGKHPDAQTKHLQRPPEGMEHKIQQPPGGEGELPENFGQIWYINETGELAMEPVETGTSDDNNIEIVRYRHLRPGMQVISGIVETRKKEKTAINNANQMFGGAPQGGGGPPPPPGGP
ncbi:MAG: efflux RND transporter periplasmic adaptor subunit [Bacteroidales bacterium]|nr:MAG: efflux RND transporter periplasmic adaptor subunit [Bacteroidales bacterium]